MKTPMWLVAFGLLLAGGLFATRHLIGRRASRSESDLRSAAVGGADGRLESQVAALQRQVGRLAASQLSGGADAQKQAPAAAAPLAAPPLSPEEEQRRSAARVDEQVQLLQRTFEQERPDPSWSEGARKTLLAAYASGSFSGVPVDAQCRRTFCRLSFQFAGGEQARQVGQMITLRAPWACAAFTQLNTSTGRAIAYLARPEHQLPQPEPEGPVR